MKKSANRYRVECYSGHRYAQEPRAFTWQGTRYTVDRLRNSWRSPRGLHFVIDTAGGAQFELVYNQNDDVWNVNPLAPEG